MKSVLVLLNVSIAGKFQVLGMVYTQYCVRPTVQDNMLLQNRIFAKNNILKIWLAELGEDTPAMTPEMAFWDHKPLFCLRTSELSMF